MIHFIAYSVGGLVALFVLLAIRIAIGIQRDSEEFSRSERQAVVVRQQIDRAFDNADRAIQNEINRYRQSG